MFRLFSFLSRYRDSFLLLSLFLVALFLIVRANDHQRHVAGDAMLNASGEAQNRLRGFSDYFGLRQENEILTTKNSLLRQQLDQARQQLEAYSGIINLDTLQALRLDSMILANSDTFSYVPARVLKNTTHKSYNYLVLNKGSSHGVKVDRGVISPEGVVGRVIRVVDDYCLVQSALNVDFELMIRAIPKGATDTLGPIGFYDWGGRNNRLANITYVSETVNVNPNDEVITTGNSIVFPPGILVGTVSDVQKKGTAGFYKIEMELATDFNNLRNVYILSMRHREKIDSLEIGLPQE